ncbi:putative CoA-binding protein [Acetoanaerobium pronyense]|uniref:CoA-binding protein n=1 Tax=Acetoanaerobium pronyense TaxID=1482736 RepID=A0ABS4KIK0_9FIRM|nr:putative CoA-binding protein [Acetoanaerobium pronyense]
MNIKEEMLSKKRWVVYGVSPDESKFGYKIPQRMIDHGYEVYGVNPKYKGEKIAGVDVYASISEIAQEIDCIDIVVNPKIAVGVLEEAKENNIKNIWLQPGTWDENVLNKAEDLNLEVVYDDCVYAILGPK